MLNFKSTISGLDVVKGARLEVTSGKRARIVIGADVRTLGDDLLSEDAILEACKQFGGARAIHDLSERPVSWVANGPTGAMRITVVLRGRDVSATFAPIPPRPAAAPERKKSSPPRKLSAKVAATRAQTPPHGERIHTKKAERASMREAQLGRQDTQRPRPAASSLAMPPDRSAEVREEIRGRDVARREAPRAEEARAEEARREKARGEEAREEARREDARQEARREEARLEDARQEARREEARREDARQEARREEARREEARAVPAPLAAPQPHVAQAAAAPVVAARGPQRDRPPRVEQAFMDVLIAAKRFEASDIHLTVGQPPALRVAGSFRNLKVLLTKEEIERAVLGLVPESRAAELRETGGVSFAVDVPGDMRLRVNATVSLAGSKLAIRLVRKTPPSTEELGLPLDVTRAIEQPQGLVLIVGPSGHGKTTTLASLVDAINQTRAVHILVVEDPMEIPIASKMSVVSQREVGRHARSFERALKGALRQDPDVIAVGELRDLETMRIALAASETGHLVLGTMNAPSAPRAIERIIDVFPPAEQPQIRATLAGGLRLVMSQRLVPAKDGVTRVAAVEILPGMVQLWNLIREEKTFQIPGLMQRGRGLGITRLEDSLARLVEQGKITEDASRETMLDAEARPEPIKAPPLAPTNEPAEGEREELLSGLLQKAGALFQRKGGS